MGFKVPGSPSPPSMNVNISGPGSGSASVKTPGGNARVVTDCEYRDPSAQPGRSEAFDPGALVPGCCIRPPEEMLKQLKALKGFTGNCQDLQTLVGNLTRPGGPMAGALRLLGRLGCLVSQLPPVGIPSPGQPPARPHESSPLESGDADIRSIVDDPNLSIEEKVALALMKMAENQEDKLEDQLRKMSGKEGAPQGGGPFGSAGALFGGGATTLSASSIVDKAGGLVGGLLGGGSTTSSSSSSGSSATGNAGERKESEQIGAQKLQMIMQKMGRLLSALSGVMKSFHQTSSTAIRNIT